MTKNTSILGLWVLALSTNPVTGVEKPAGLTSSAVPRYEVECPKEVGVVSPCVVDDGTYAGWAFYSRYCISCHGDAAKGTDQAPRLVDRLNSSVDYDRVNFVLMHGHQGDVGSMPSWSDNRAVVENIDNLYRYLKARADGALPSDAPKPKFE